MTVFLDARTRTVDVRFFVARRERARSRRRVSSADRILFVLIDFLRRHHIRLGPQTDLVVVTGPGIFSCVRAAVTIANALAFASRVRLHALRAADEITPIPDQEIFAAGKRRSVPQLTPQYGRAPSITLKSSL